VDAFHLNRRGAVAGGHSHVEVVPVAPGIVFELARQDILRRLRGVQERGAEDHDLVLFEELARVELEHIQHVRRTGVASMQLLVQASRLANVVAQLAVPPWPD